MKKLLTIMAFVFLMSAVGIHAQIPNTWDADNMNHLYSLNETSGTNAVDSMGVTNGTLTNAFGNDWTTGVYANAINVTGATEYLSIPTAQNFNGDHSIGGWFKIQSTGSNIYLMSRWDDIGSNAQLLLVYTPTNNVKIDYMSTPFPTEYSVTSDETIPLNTWTHIAFTYDTATNNISLYINGTMVKSVIAGADPQSTTTEDIEVGCFYDNEECWDFQADDIFITNGVVYTPQNISDIYTNNFGGGPTNFTITLSSPTAFNVTIDGTDTYSTVSGTIVTDILSGDPSTHDVVISAGNYFSASYDDYNVSGDISTSLLRYPLVRVYNRWTGANVSDFIVHVYETSVPRSYTITGSNGYIPENITGVNMTVAKVGWYHSQEKEIDLLPAGAFNTTIYETIVTLGSVEKASLNPIQNWSIWYQGNNFSTTSYLLTIYPNIGSYTFNWTNEQGYYPRYGVNLTVAGNQDTNLTGFHNVNVTIAAHNAYSGASLANISGWAYYPATGYNESFTTASGPQVLNLTAGEWTIFVESPEYSISSANYKTETITAPTDLFNFSLYSSNSVFIHIYDEDTSLPAYVNISVTFTGNTTEDIYYTATSQLLVENLTDGSYSVKFQGGNYTLKSYNVVVAHRSFQTLNAYLSQSSENVILTFLDFDTGATLQGVDLSMYRLINSTWTLVQAKQSDISGRVQLQYTPAIKYRFDAVLNGYTTNLFYLDPVIFDSYNVRLTKVTTLQNDIDYLGVSISYFPTLFYINRTNSLTWIIESPLGVIEDYNLTVTYPGGSGFYSGVSTIGEQFIHPFNITGAGLTDRVNISYCYDISIGSARCFSFAYAIIGVYGNYTYMSNIDRTYGLGLFERIVIATLAVLIIAGFLTFLAGPIIGSVVGLFIWGFLSYIGFVALWAILPSLFVGFIVISWRSSQ